jgi:hypothetical protein
MTDIDPRWQKGTQMAFQKDAVRRLDEHTYLVKSQTQIGGYVIITTRSGWKCNCPDHTFRKPNVSTSGQSSIALNFEGKSKLTSPLFLLSSQKNVYIVAQIAS